MNQNKYSYSAANVFPMKLLLDVELIESCRKHKKILPRHLQLNPTNRCNFNCSFCSCKMRDRNLELNFLDICNFLLTFKECGGKSVTITGGGEPTLHDDFSKIISFCDDIDLEIGLVTNGSILYTFNNVLKHITWIRISSSDELPFQLGNLGLNFDVWLNRLSDVISKFPKIDWSFSHVVTAKSNSNYIRKLILFANQNNFTHVRLVNDIFVADKLKRKMDDLHSALLDIDLSKVIFQTRSEWTKGFNPCYISLLKPVLGADGYLYPCCGTQYALENPSKDYEPSMRLGRMEDFKKIVEEQRFFNGERCVKCYYSNYNIALDVLMKGLKHEAFV